MKVKTEKQPLGGLLSVSKIGFEYFILMKISNLFYFEAQAIQIN